MIPGSPPTRSISINNLERGEAGRRATSVPSAVRLSMMIVLLSMVIRMMMMVVKMAKAGRRATSGPSAVKLSRAKAALYVRRDRFTDHLTVSC